jgi:DNA-directed RNA polymerase
VTAPYVNLVPSDLPGDLYAYVGTHVWETIALELAKLQKHEIKECNNFIDTVADQKRQINEAELRSDRRKDLISEIIAYKKENERILKKSSCVYWHRIVDSKHKRKLVKRGVMTLSYGATSYGLGQQVIDDARKHGIEQLFSMEHAWGSYLGRIILEDCATSLEKPMRLLSVFEQAGRAAEAVNEFLSWTVPITNFPVVQHYTEGTVKKIYVQYGPPEGDRNSSGYYENTLQLAICFLEDSKPSKKKQAQGASPNAIHSLDAAHLTLAVCRADFPVTTIHDSFGCLLGDMADLFIIIRETFVELYAADPLTSLMRDIKGDISSVEIGNLDLTLILDSEYAFA